MRCNHSGQRGLGSNGNDGVLDILQISKARALPSDSFMSYPVYSLVGVGHMQRCSRCILLTQPTGLKLFNLIFMESFPAADYATGIQLRQIFLFYECFFIFSRISTFVLRSLIFFFIFTHWLFAFRIFHHHHHQRQQQQHQVMLTARIPFCPVGWGCRIHWLHFCRGVRQPHPPQRVSWI